MKLIEATIHNYRCVGSNCVLPLDRKVTALVGKSETGKTAILRAIQRFFDTEPYQASELCSWRQPANGEPMCSIRFEPAEDEREVLGQLHESLGGDRSIVICKLRDGSHKIVEPDIGTTTVLKLSADSERRIGNLRARARKLLRSTGAFLHQYTDSELRSMKESLDRQVNARKFLHPADTPEAQDAGFGAAITELDRLVDRLAEMAPWSGDAATSLKRTAVRLRNDLQKTRKAVEFEAEQASSVSADKLMGVLPNATFVRDTDIKPISDAVALSELRSAQNRPVRQLLALGGISDADLAIEDETDRDRILVFGAETASRTLSERWSQEGIRVTFAVSANKLRLALISEEGHYGTPSQRSEGFLWFLTFLLSFVPPSSEEESSLLLLDEPGIHLHADAQRDLLGLLDTIAGHSQVIYTTHSPFMINKNLPWRIRAVRKNRRGAKPQGTYVESKPYASPSGRAWEPIRSSIGLSGGSSLFIAGRNLVVEGIADQIMLAAFSQRLARDDVPSLDLDRVSITPAGGAASVYSLAHLCHAESEATVVLLDSDPAGDKTKAKIEKGRVIPTRNVIQVGDIAQRQKDRAIELEDLVDSRLYHGAVVNAYSKVPPERKLPESFEGVEQALAPNQGAKKGPGGKMSLKKVYERLFESNAEDWGDFDNVLVASELAETCLGEGQPEGLSESLDNFAKLFKEINSRLA